MKKVRLNENDIENLVKKIIKEETLSEIDKKTWASAAEKARERGMSGLGDKFTSHSRERGTTVVDNISFDVMYSKTSKDTFVFNDFEFKNSERFTAKNDEDRVMGFDVSSDARRGELKTYLHGDNLVYPTTVRDAKNYLSLLNDNGIDTLGLRPKQITSGYAN